MDDQIKYFLYIDNDIINSIYNQMPHSVVPSRIIQTNIIDGSIKSEIGFRTMRLLSGKLNPQVDAQKETKVEIQKQVTVEYKINEIINSVNNGNIYVLFDILDSINEYNVRMISFKSLFRFIRAYDEDEKCYIQQSDLERNPLKYNHLSFSFCSTPNLASYNESENVLSRVFETGDNYVEMYFSGSKMTRSVKHLTTNIQYGKDFVFYVLGEICYVKRNQYSIKPYAIWRMNNNNI